MYSVPISGKRPIYLPHVECQTSGLSIRHQHQDLLSMTMMHTLSISFKHKHQIISTALPVRRLTPPYTKPHFVSPVGRHNNRSRKLSLYVRLIAE